MSTNRELTVELWALEDIERELQSIANEAMHLPPGPTLDRVQGCAEAALETLRKVLGRQ